jgi:hypothetical protein
MQGPEFKRITKGGKNEVSMHGTTWMNLKNMQSETSQA